MKPRRGSKKPRRPVTGGASRCEHDSGKRPPSDVVVRVGDVRRVHRLRGDRGGRRHRPDDRVALVQRRARWTLRALPLVSDTGIAPRRPACSTTGRVAIEQSLTAATHPTAYVCSPSVIAADLRGPLGEGFVRQRLCRLPTPGEQRWAGPFQRPRHSHRKEVRTAEGSRCRACRRVAAGSGAASPLRAWARGSRARHLGTTR
jgi:hypothetical protein